MPSFRELLESARDGDAGSQCDLAMMYAIGQDVDEDEEEAAYWWTQAAQQGHVASQYNLANSYYRGEGVERDYEQAALWYRKAAEHAHDGIVIDLSDFHSPSEVKVGIMTSIQAAFINLGRCYGNGHGVSKDDVEAYAFYNLGCSMGGKFSEVARNNIMTLGRKMGRAEVAEGQRRTRELKAYYCKISL
jgi:TPR repeat protein